MCDERKLKSPVGRATLALSLVLLCGCVAEEHTNSGSVTVAAHFEFVDGYGDTISISAPTPRIISLAPNLSEVVAAIDSRDLLVGRTEYCTYPPEIDTIESVGTLGGYNYERIVALQPDVILMMTFNGSSKKEYDKLKELGLRPVAFSEYDVRSVIGMIDTVGRLIGRKEESGPLVASMESRLDSLEQLARSEPAVPTFVVVESSPIITVSGGFITAMIESAGGSNVVDDPLAYPRYSRESLIGSNPSAIVLTSTAESAVDDFLALYPEVNLTAAGKNNGIHAIDPDLIARPGPRVLDGIEAIRATLHPD